MRKRFGNLRVDGRIISCPCALTEHHAMKAYWEWRHSSTNSLTSTLDGGEWSVSRSGRFTPRERTPSIHLIGGWVGPRAVLDAVMKRKIPSSRRESNPGTPIIQPVAHCYTDWAITALRLWKCFYLLKQKTWNVMTSKPWALIHLLNWYVTLFLFISDIFCTFWVLQFCQFSLMDSWPTASYMTFWWRTVMGR
jgi:hypothetical protein